MDYFIRCNDWNVHVDVTERRVKGDWGGEQCEGCGLDIAGTGTVKRLAIGSLSQGTLARWVVRCDECGAEYLVKEG